MVFTRENAIACAQTEEARSCRPRDTDAGYGGINHTRYAWFRKHGCAPREALAHARTETSAEERNLGVHYEHEQEAWDGECPAPRYVLCLSVGVREDGFVAGYRICLASCGMVGVESLRDPYLRILTTELYAEALLALDAEDQCAADALAQRATYAGIL